MPTWALFHSRHWKMQIPFLARHYRVVTFDGRGNGRSDRPEDDRAYGDLDNVADAVAVLDATGTDRCFVAGVSLGGKLSVLLAADHPERVRGVVAITPAAPLGAGDPDRSAVIRWNDRIDDPQGWEKHNRHYWLSDYADWAEFFVDNVFSEPHSTKPREDGLGWALETDGATLVRTFLSEFVGAAHHRGRRPRSDGARSGRREPCHRGVRRAGRDDPTATPKLDQGSLAPQARPLRLISDRPRPRPPRRRHRR
jgi:pimeloyl-ACP methyl ester carboxylesterase